MVQLSATMCAGAVPRSEPGSEAHGSRGGRSCRGDAPAALPRQGLRTLLCGCPEGGESSTSEPTLPCCIFCQLSDSEPVHSNHRWSLLLATPYLACQDESSIGRNDFKPTSEHDMLGHCPCCCCSLSLTCGRPGCAQVVFCLVELRLTVQDAKLAPELASLSTSQQKLLAIYVDRAKQQQQTLTR